MSDPIDPPGFWEDFPTLDLDDTPRCYGCHREMCPELDQYWGTDSYWGRYCIDCRTSRLRASK